MSKRLSILTEGTVLAIVPAACYALVYIYQSGVDSVYGLGTDFINVDFVAALKTFFALGILYAFGFIITEFYELQLKLRPGLKLPILRLLISFLYLCFITLIYLPTDYTKTSIIKYALYPVLLYVFIDFILPLIFHGSTKGFWNKVAHSETVHQDFLRQRNNFIGKAISQLPGGVATFLFLTFFVFVGSYHLGVTNAIEKRDYFKVEGSNNVIIKSTPDYVITARIDGINITQNFTIYPVQNTDTPLVLSRYDGPQLKPVKPLHR